MAVGQRKGENHISIPFRDGHLIMTLPEAKHLEQRLRDTIQRVDGADGQIHAPRMTYEGFLTHDDFYDFFVQIYTEHHSLSAHAGKIFGFLIRSWDTQYHLEPIDLVVCCAQCGKHLREPSCDGQSPQHKYHSGCTPMISVESLKRHARIYTSGELRGFGKTMIADLNFLLVYL
jgi:hypothetical protein